MFFRTMSCFYLILIFYLIGPPPRRSSFRNSIELKDFVKPKSLTRPQRMDVGKTEREEGIRTIIRH